jgi:branched-chain amino acid aminotransferase
MQALRSVRQLSTFYFKDLKIERATTTKPMPAEFPFGSYFTDHMFEVDHSVKSGWGTPKITPFHNFDMHPSNTTLHYGIECFEGMKAFRNETEVLLFRPEKNLNRLLESFKFLTMPEFDPAELQKILETLVDIDKSWIPNKPDHSLYLRPTGISMENRLGVHPPTDSKLFIIMSPTGPYFSKGFSPLRLFVEEEGARSWPGGPGSKKLGANYGPTMFYQQRAVQKKFDQILWLSERKYISEAGTMNFFIYWTNKKGVKEVVTPKLDGTLLPGITRLSIIEMLKADNVKVTEKLIKMTEFVEASKENRVHDCFTTGTACVTHQVRSFNYQGVEYTIPEGKLAGDLKTKLQDIQYGRVKSPWTKVIAKY